MAKVMWTSKHIFKSELHLRKHLKKDEKNFLKIASKLKKLGIINAKRGIVAKEKNLFAHMGFILFKNKQAYKKAMRIINQAKWDKKIPKKNRYETFVLDKEIY